MKETKDSDTWLREVRSGQKTEYRFGNIALFSCFVFSSGALSEFSHSYTIPQKTFISCTFASVLSNGEQKLNC